MNYTLLGYGLYLTLTTVTLLGVSTLLFRHGSAFLRQAYAGDPEQAEATGLTLRTQYRLLAAATVLLQMSFRRPGETAWPLTPLAPDNAPELFEALSVKLGVALLALGALHFLTLRRINHIRTTGELY